MSLFLVTCVYDEGLYDSSFVAVEAESKLDVARHMLSHLDRWTFFLDRCCPKEVNSTRAIYPNLFEGIAREPSMAPERLLELIDRTGVDGDSNAQLRIFELQPLPLEQVETDWWKRVKARKT